MKECDICKQEKKEDEFKCMAKYGCTCKTSHFCKGCILEWLETNSGEEEVSLKNWVCLVCRNKAMVKKESPSRLHFIPSTQLEHVLEGVEEKRRLMCQAWNNAYSSFYIGHYILEDVVTDSLCSRYRYIYQAGPHSFFCMILDIAHNSLFKGVGSAFLPVDIAETKDRLSNYMDSTYSKVKKLIETCQQSLSSVELQEVLDNLNLLHADVYDNHIVNQIHALHGHEHDPEGLILLQFMHFQRLKPTMTFQEFYLTPSIKLS